MHHKEANVDNIKTEKQLTLTFTATIISGEDECNYCK